MLPGSFTSRRPLGLVSPVLISLPLLLGPRRVSALAEGASRGLQGAFQSFIQVLVFKDLGQSSSCTHTYTLTHKLALTHISVEMHTSCSDNIKKEGKTEKER